MEFVELTKGLAADAYRAISFSSEKRGASTEKWFNEAIREEYKILSELAVSEPQKEVLNIEFERYQNNFKSKYEAYLHAKSRTMSPMITGPAKFPVRSNEKKMATERKRSEEFDQWSDKAFKAIKKKIAFAATPEQMAEQREKSNDKVMAYLLQESASTIGCMTGDLPYSTQLIKGALERKIMNFAKGEPDLALRIVNEINLLAREKCNKDVFTSRHKIFKAIETIKEQISQPQEVKGNEQLYKHDHFEVVNNFSEERVQILFDGKPSVDVRNILKSNGFRWSPRNEAWQRQNTNNGIYAANAVCKALLPLNTVEHFN